ncbi:integral membrane protein S linking to the trans Golgi network-domain-containing protein [Cunninghamella echinulata]|nr:integral membrane protein S linking to the trans Golgi network-domain-containing protein [Cunninghamella echinulata]
MSSFRLTGWDPILNIAQIISLQSVNMFTMDNVFGWTLGLVWIVNAMVDVILILLIVQRAKQVLDFVLTLHGGHVLACWLFVGKFPTNLSWWFVQVLAILIMTLGGEWACMKYEMKPILIQSSLKGENKNKNMQLLDNDDSDDNDLPSSSTNNGNDNISRKKRKQSDVKEEEGPLTAVVGIAKQAVMEKMKLKKTKDYDLIPLNNINN